MSKALEASLLLTQLALEFGLMAQRYSLVLGKARAEGRDITDAELDSLKADRTAAVERWLRG